MNESAQFYWADGRGEHWTIQVDPELISLRNGDESMELPKSSWPHDVIAAASGGSVIIRFQGPQRDVGFLVPKAEADQFLNALGRSADRIEARPLRDTATTSTSAAMSMGRGASFFSEGDTSSQRAELLFPRMTTGVVWAVICSALSFLPIIGVLFALVSVWLVLRFFRKQRQTAAYRHARIAARLALLFSGFGFAICAVSTWGFWQVFSGVWLEQELNAPPMPDSPWIKYVIPLVIVLASLSVHEAAHAITAWWCGDDYAKSQGRVTLNPVAHIDPFGTVLLPALLTFAGAPAFGYARPVPVISANLRRFRRDDILISLAGPGSNLLIAAGSLATLLAMGCALRILVPDLSSAGFVFSGLGRLEGVPGGEFISTLAFILKESFLINLYLAFFNLVPVPPLDGSWVLEHLYPNSIGRLIANIRPYGTIAFLVMLWSDAFNYLLEPVHYLGAILMLVVSLCTGL